MGLAKNVNLEHQDDHFKMVHVSYKRDVAALNTLQKYILSYSPSSGVY